MDDMQNPVFVNQFNPSPGSADEVSNIYFSPNNQSIIYVSNSINGFFRADISDKMNPVISQSGTILGGHLDDIVVLDSSNTAENYLAVAIGMRGAAIISQLNPGVFALVAHIPVFGKAMGLSLSCDGKYLIVASRDNGLSIVDIQNKTGPKIITIIYSSSNEQVHMSKDCQHLFVADGYFLFN